MSRGPAWGKLEEKAFAAVYPYFPNPLIAQGFGRTEPAIAQKGPQLGLRKTTRGRTNGALYAHISRRRNRLTEARLQTIVDDVRRRQNLRINAIARAIRRKSCRS